MTRQNDPMLDTLITELRRTKRVRRTRAACAGGALVMALIATPLLLTGPAPVQTPAPSGPTIAHGSTTPENAPSIPGIEAQDPSTRIAVLRASTTSIPISHSTTPSVVERLDDDALLAELDRTGRRAGLIRRGGEAFLDAEWLTSETEESEPSSLGDPASSDISI